MYKYDLSLPLDGMYELVEAVRRRLRHLGSDVVVAGYGHVGDGNLHLNVSDGTREHDKVRSRAQCLCDVGHCGGAGPHGNGSVTSRRLLSANHIHHCHTPFVSEHIGASCCLPALWHAFAIHTADAAFTLVTLRGHRSRARAQCAQ